MTIVIFPLHSAATSLVSGLGLVVLGSAVLFPVRSSWWQWGPKRRQNSRQLFLSCVTKQSVSFMPPVALKSRLDVVFRATPSCVHHRGWGLCLSYLHHAAVQTTRASAYAALTSGSLQRSGLSQGLQRRIHQTRADNRGNSARWFGCEIHHSDTRCGSPRKGHAEQKCRFDTGSTFVPRMWKVLKCSDQRVKRGPSKRSINSCSSTHQRRGQIGSADKEKLLWMSTGRRWALKGMWITNENDFFVGVRGSLGLVHSAAPASAAKAAPGGLRVEAG